MPTVSLAPLPSAAVPPGTPAGSPSPPSTTTEEPSAPPPPSKPVNTARPKISGTAQQGDKLTSSDGAWEGEPTSYAYQWMDCNASGVSCSAIPGATSSTYTLGARDIEHTMLVVVEATNAAGTTAASSLSSQKVKRASSPPAKPANTAAPTLAGTTTRGEELTASTGSWSGHPTSFAYQWESCNASGEACTAIEGASASSYTLLLTDVGHTVRVVVTASNAGGETSATSTPSAKVAESETPPPPAPSDITLPAISGPPTESQMLIATRGTWSASPTLYTYRWELCNSSGEGCSAIGGANASTYTLPPGDGGHTLRVSVTASTTRGSITATSAGTATIASAAKQPPPSPACTQTVSSVSSAASDLASAGAGAAICLTAGSYGHLSLSGTHSGNVTIEPVPGESASLEGVSLATGASYITIHNFSIAGGVSLAAGDNHITVDHNDIDGHGAGGDGEGVETLSVNCSAPNAPTYSGCTSTAPDTYLTIDGNKIHGYGEGNTEDAIHLNDWEHVTISGNDIYELEEHGNHTDAMQSVFGGHYMTFDHNYEHDNQAQGFFLKDGDVSEVTVSENLFLTNNNLGLDEYNIQVFNTAGFTMTNNTVWDGQADIIRAEGAAEALTATVNHNVEQNFDIEQEGGPAYALNEDYDIFQEDPFTFSKGPHSTIDSSPDFANPAGDDYELASNPNGIGVDWQPSEYVYGPTGD